MTLAAAVARTVSSNQEVITYFESIGFNVGIEGRRDTGESWLEIWEPGFGVLIQIDCGVPLATLREALPWMAKHNQPWTGNLPAWKVNGPLKELRRVVKRMQSRKDSK